MLQGLLESGVKGRDRLPTMPACHTSTGSNDGQRLPGVEEPQDVHDGRRGLGTGTVRTESRTALSR